MSCPAIATRYFVLLVVTLPALAASDSADAGWPRQYSDGSAKLVLYQPQIDSWADFKKLSVRFAASLTHHKNAPPVWGVVSLECGTVANLKARTVTLDTFIVRDIRFPAARDDAESRVWQALTIKLLPARPTTMSLDSVLAYMDKAHWKIREAQVLFDPPPILVSTEPAALVIIDGDPVAVDIESTNLQKIVNTNWDLLFHKKENRYYLRDDRSWLFAPTLRDRWLPVAQLPADFSRLPATALYNDALSAAAKPVYRSVVKSVLVVHTPSELIVLAGSPATAPIPDTRLMWITNTECDLFFDSGGRQYYFLTSGRWFRSADLKAGAWTSVIALPDDFKKIPADHPRAHVLAAVAGTRQAEEAILNASIDQITTVARPSVKASARYAGDPKFEPIGDTGISYALNSPDDVLVYQDRYFLCQNGIWFTSQHAGGPWAAADSVAPEIYTIPPSSPKYHLTYVTVAGSTPDSVTYRYTAGYYGTYVSEGVVVWGTGYTYPPYRATAALGPPIYLPPSNYTYGASTWYNPATGAFARGSSVSGPYSGFGHSAAYDPATRAYSFVRRISGHYGPRYRISGSRAAIGAQSSSGKSTPGDFYAGLDGTVYKRDSSGQWFKSSGSSWADVSGSASVPLSLAHDSSARDWGNYNAMRAESTEKLNGWTGDPYVGRGISGWSLRSPGFGWKR